MFTNNNCVQRFKTDQWSIMGYTITLYSYYAIEDYHWWTSAIVHNCYGTLLTVPIVLWLQTKFQLLPTNYIYYG